MEFVAKCLIYLNIFQIPTLGGFGDSNCRNLRSFLQSACFEQRVNIELDFSYSRGGLTTINMQEQLHDALHSNISQFIFWVGSNEIEKLIRIRDQYGNFAYWDERDNLVNRIFYVLDQLVGAGKLVYVLALPIRLFFIYQYNNHSNDTKKILDEQKTRAYKSCAWNVTNRLNSYCLQVGPLYYITLPSELYHVNFVE